MHDQCLQHLWTSLGPLAPCRALYHCNYCQKDISNTPRIKCAVCADFDLCLECFSVGVEIFPHKNSHDYRVVDDLSFPIFHPDWGVRAQPTRPPHDAPTLLAGWRSNVVSATLASSVPCLLKTTHRH